MKRGWCPTLDAPMEAADGWLVRVRPPLGRLTAPAARALADAAEHLGRGLLELTSHANLQVRAVRDVPAFARAMTEAGLPSPIGRLIVSPLAGDDPDCAAGTLDAAAAAERRLAREGVPRPKHTVVVDGGGAWGLADVVADERTVLGPSRPAAGVPAGPLPYRGGAGFGFGLPFGEITPPTLRALAGLAEAHGDGTLRLTPWRCLLIARARGRVEPPPGVVADPADPVMRTAACIGNAGCAQGTVPARDDARRLARPGLHVSGCAKGCAHPGPAAWTLVGRDGRYDLVRNGTARDQPVRHRVRIGAAP